MDFSFSEEQTTISELAREILGREAETARVKEVERSADWMDEELWSKLAEANLLGIAIPEALGGMGMGFLELCSLLEEVGRVVAPLPVLETLVLGALPLAVHGTDAQRSAWLPAVASGEAVLTAALDDPGSADPAAPATTAIRDGAAYLLSGAKRPVPFARRADRILVPAATDDGVCIFLVDPRSAGVTLDAQTTSTGAPFFALGLDAVRVLEGDRLGGAEADGAALVAWIREHALVGIAALQMGVSDQAIQITAGYVREREQFGVPIGSFQAVQHRAADGFIDLEALRWCTWRAAFRLAEGLSAAREAAVAKFWAADAGSRIANSCVHLHGGMGSDTDYPIHRYFLWSKALELSPRPGCEHGSDSPCGIQ